MEQDIPEKEIQQEPNPKENSRFYDKPWVRPTALVLALSMIFSIWANGAIHVKIRKSHEMDAATNYLVDNTDYVNEDELKRLQEKLLAYQQATELEDYYRLAGTQIAEESYEEALVSIDKCIALYPGENETLFVDLMLKRACLLVLLLREDEAMLALDEVLEHKPDHADAYLIKAQILFELQRFEEVIEQYRTILEDPAAAEGQSEIWYLFGLTYLQLSDYAQSEEALILAKQDNPGLDGLDYYIGICQMSREAYREAVESFTAAIDAGSMLQHSHYSRGVCRIMADGSAQAALEDLRFASEYTGADADPNVKLQSDDLLAQLQGVINAS